MEKIKLKENKGITLVALVVTIIVLLILAGVSISMLTGQNGILNRSASAKEKTQEEGLKEEISLAVQSAMTKGLGVLTKENLETELGNIAGAQVTYDESAKKFTVSRDGYAFTVDLNGNVVSANGIVLDKSTLSLLTGKSETLTVSYVGSASGTVTWTSSDTSVATVDSSGKVTAKGESGTATITATCGSYTTKCTLTITQKITAISAEAISVGTGKTKKIEVKTTPDANIEGITYSYSVKSGTSYAKVDSSTGVVTGVAVGSATVTITGTTESNATVSTTCTVSVVEIVSGTLDDKGFTWNALSNASQAISNGTATALADGTGYKYSKNNKDIVIGDTKSIIVGEKTYLAVVIGFNHDKLSTSNSEYGTYAGISFQLKDCLDTKAKMNSVMNSSSTNSGSWASSAMRKYLNKNGTKADGTSDASQDCIYNQIESDAKNVIKQVKKVTATEYNATTVTSTDDYLWILSEKEVFGARNHSNSTEFGNESNTQYSYYADKNNSKIKKLNGKSCYWWLRSPRYIVNKDFCIVNSNGLAYYMVAGFAGGVAFGFAI